MDKKKEIKLKEMVESDLDEIVDDLGKTLEFFEWLMQLGIMYYGNHKLMLVIDDKPIPLADYMKMKKPE